MDRFVWHALRSTDGSLKVHSLMVAQREWSRVGCWRCARGLLDGFVAVTGRRLLLTVHWRFTVRRVDGTME